MKRSKTNNENIQGKFGCFFDSHDEQIVALFLFITRKTEGIALFRIIAGVGFGFLWKLVPLLSAISTDK